MLQMTKIDILGLQRTFERAFAKVAAVQREMAEKKQLRERHHLSSVI